LCDVSYWRSALCALTYLVIEHWIALYRIVEDGVQTVRAVDGVRDLSKLDWKPE
jgi:hypothetical protein